jgi:hypothetical protein
MLTMIDISDRKKMEMELNKTIELLRAHKSIISHEKTKQ